MPIWDIYHIVVYPILWALINIEPRVEYK